MWIKETAETDAIEAAAQLIGVTPEYMAYAIEAYKANLRPVSLLYCTERLRDRFTMSQNSDGMSLKWEDLAKDVLEQAGVAYVK